MTYKGSKLVTPTFFALKTITQTSNDNYDFKEEINSEIQSVFSQFSDLNPENIDDQTQSVFNKLEEIVNSEKCLNNLPKIVQHSVYPRLVEYLDKTKNDRFHLIISQILVSLTMDSNISSELLQFNILKVIDDSVCEFNFPRSTPSLFKIISNYLSDSNESNSLVFHKRYPLDYIFKILQFIKSTISYTPSITCVNEIVNAWMKCVYETISIYPNEPRPTEVSITLIEMHKYFDIVANDPLLCRYLCYTINIIIDRNLIVYSDFNLYGYPKFIINLTNYGHNEEVRAYALVVLGKLIQINRLSINFDFLDIFNIILNENSSNILLSSAFFVCKSCLINNFIAIDAFDTLSNNIEYLIDLYEIKNSIVRFDMLNLFACYVLFFVKSNCNSSMLKIIKITDIFLEFLPLSDDLEIILNILESIFMLNNYFIDNNGFNSPSLQEYKLKFIDCMNEMKQSEESQIVELADKMLATLN